MDKEFARRAREGVADGDTGRAVCIADESTSANWKRKWIDRRNRLAQHVAYKDLQGELKWRKTYAELNLPRRRMY